MNLTDTITTLEEIDGVWTLVHEPPKAVVLSTELVQTMLDVINSKVSEDIEEQIRKDERDAIIATIKRLQSSIMDMVKWDFSPTGKVTEVVAAAFLVLLNDLEGKPKGRGLGWDF